MRGETGFPSPAQGYEAKVLDFNKILVTNPPATFVMRLVSNELTHKGIYPDSYLVVDRSKPLTSGDLVVFCAEGEFHCREYYCQGHEQFFLDGNGCEIPITEQMVIFGVATRELRYL